MSNSRLASELAGLKAKPYWREDDGRIAMEAWQRSELSLTSFAKQHGLGLHRLRWWRDRLRRGNGSPALSPDAIVPVTVVGSSRPATTSGAIMEVVLASGRLVRVGAEFDAEALVRLVRALEDSC
jgi:transposase-like protein